MKLLLLIIVSLLGVLGIGYFLYDSYKHSLCKKCENNLNTKRVRGEKVCSIHGKL